MSLTPEIRLNYRRYEFAVQNPPALLKFMEREFRVSNRRRPLALREDFCGSAKLAIEWVKQSPRHTVVGVDLAEEPIEYARTQHVSKLTRAQQRRVEFFEGDVRKIPATNFDVIVALNFSYCVFHQRAELLDYFKEARKALNPGGIFMIDLFGGSRSQEAGTRKTDMGKFQYQWECVAFNPVRNRGTYAIHFKPKGAKLVPNAFVYDWRVWTCPELMDVMQDAGFENITPYWEGDDPRGRGGDGKFAPTEWEENCYIWQSFIIGRK